MVDVLNRIDEKKNRSGNRERHAVVLTQMGTVFPGAEIQASRDRAYGYGLKDPGDEYVLHEALMSGADAIVADNQRAELIRTGIVHEASIEILTGEKFLINTVAAHRDQDAYAVLHLY